MKYYRLILRARGIQLGVSILLGLCILLAYAKSKAGECPESINYYIEQLEKLSQLGPPYKTPEAFWCLSCFPEDWKLWAGPIAARRFDGCRNSPFRERIAAACQPLLDDTTSTSFALYDNVQLGAASLLATYGFGRVGEHDIFEIITSFWNTFEHVPTRFLIALAAQQDQRTVSFLSAVYDSLKTDDENYYEHYVVGITNCIYHIPGNQAVELAKKIYQQETDKYIRERAYRVLKR